MADCILLTGGSGFDDSEVTATPDSVRVGKLFLGAGNDNVQSGRLNEVPAATYALPLNGRQDIPPGLHSGDVVVRQTGIARMEGTTVYPRDYDQAVNTANKYMDGDIYVAALAGLAPGNIKKGVTILGVTGTYEGYN